MQQKLNLISRSSNLALIQSNLVANQLKAYYPNLQIDICGVATRGDKNLVQSLAKIGGKGLFTQELEQALIDGSCDLAVHSTKDITATLDDKFTIAAYIEREDATDAFISNKYLSIDQMPDGSIIGTASARREVLLKKYYPHLLTKLLRGNVNTRLKKLDDNEYDAIILASAGLIRLNMQHRIRQKLGLDTFIPAIGQGVLAIEVLKQREDLIALLQPLNHGMTRIAVETERRVGEILQVGCSVPIAVHAVITNNEISLNAYLSDALLQQQCTYSGKVKVGEHLSLAKLCADSLLNQGAAEIIQRLRK
jgi:hydroxymethylbilane synthase